MPCLQYRQRETVGIRVLVALFFEIPGRAFGPVTFCGEKDISVLAETKMMA